MTVKELKNFLESFGDDARIVLLDTKADVYEVDLDMLYDENRYCCKDRICWVDIKFSTHCDGC